MATIKNGGTGPAATVNIAKVAQDARAIMPISVACDDEREEGEEAMEQGLSCVEKSEHESLGFIALQLAGGGGINTRRWQNNHRD
jgi:hypothetical protein